MTRTLSDDKNGLEYLVFNISIFLIFLVAIRLRSFVLLWSICTISLDTDSFCQIYHYPFHQLAFAFIVKTTANQWLYLDYIVNVVWLEVSKLYTTRNHILCGEPWNGMKRKYPGNMSLMCNKNTSILWLTFVESLVSNFSFSDIEYVWGHDTLILFDNQLFTSKKKSGIFI